jgi:hypothetical protein
MLPSYDVRCVEASPGFEAPDFTVVIRFPLSMGQGQPNDSHRFSAKGIRVKDRWIVTAWIALVMLLVPAVVLFIVYLSGYEGRTWPESIQPLIFIGWFGGPLLGLAAIVLSAWTTTRSGAIQVKERELLVERADRLALFQRTDVQGAYVVDDIVRIAVRGHKVLLVQLPSEQREELVSALGFGLRQRRNACEFGNGWLSSAGCLPPLLGFGTAFTVSGLLLTIGGVSLGSVSNYIGGAVWLVVTIATAAATPWRRVTVGVDGLWVETFLTGHFVPLVEVGQLKVGAWWHQLARTKDRRVRLCWRAGSDLSQCMALAARVRALQTVATNERPIPADVLTTLDRGGRPFQAWISDLRALNEDIGHYRIAPNRLEALHIALLSLGASVEQRLGAAVALMAGEDAQADLVRQAAESIARPATRRALLEVADGRLTETALANALAA